MLRILPTTAPLGNYGLFSDESGISGHRYMLIGGVFCTVPEAHRIHKEIAAIRSDSPFPSDSLQWKNITRRKIPIYQRFIDYLLVLIHEKILDYIVVVIDTRQLDPARYNKGDAETFFQKMICELVEAKSKEYNFPPCIRIIHGQRESRYHLEEVRAIINQTLRIESDDWHYVPLKQLDYIDVQKSGLHQAADLLLGCTAYYWNPSMRKLTNSSKSEIAEYLRKNCPLDRLDRGSPPTYRRYFNVWPLQLRGDPRP
jgi:hypothetical protein